MPRVLVLGRAVDRMLADAFEARALDCGGPSWPDWLAVLVGARPARAAHRPGPVARAWARRTVAERVTLVLDPRPRCRGSSAYGDVSTVPEPLSADAVDLARRVAAVLGLLVTPDRRTALLPRDAGPAAAPTRRGPRLRGARPPAGLGHRARRADASSSCGALATLSGPGGGLDGVLPAYPPDGVEHVARGPGAAVWRSTCCWTRPDDPRRPRDADGDRPHGAASCCTSAPPRPARRTSRTCCSATARTSPEHGICYPADRFDAHFLAALDLMRLPWGGLETEAVGRLGPARGGGPRRARAPRSSATRSWPPPRARRWAGRWPRSAPTTPDGPRCTSCSPCATWCARSPPSGRRTSSTAAPLSYAPVPRAHPRPRAGDAASAPGSGACRRSPTSSTAGATTCRPSASTWSPCRRPGAPPGLLWERFACAFGLDGLDLDLTAERANPSLGVPETALLRRINRVGQPGARPARLPAAGPRAARPPDPVAADDVAAAAAAARREYPWVQRPRASPGSRRSSAAGTTSSATSSDLVGAAARRGVRRPGLAVRAGGRGRGRRRDQGAAARERPAARRGGPPRRRARARPGTSSSGPTCGRRTCSRQRVVRRLERGPVGRGAADASTDGCGAGTRGRRSGRSARSRTRRRRARPRRPRSGSGAPTVAAIRLPATLVIRSEATSVEMSAVERRGRSVGGRGQRHRRGRELLLA